MPFMKELFIVDLDYSADSTQFVEPFADDPWTCFLDSCSASFEREHHNRFDILTASPWATVTIEETGEIQIDNTLTGLSEQTTDQSPFAVLDDLLASMTVVNNAHLPFTGGAVGFWGYELIGTIESKRIAARNLNSPVMGVGLYHWALITDHQNKTTKVVFHPDISEAKKDEVLKKLDLTQPPEEQPFTLHKKFVSTISEKQYSDAFDKVQEYILSGDSYEINLTQEFTSQYEGNCWTAYKHLRTVSPAPYSAYINHPKLNILSHSPERFIKVSERKVETHPIKGTRPRGATAEEDQQHIDDLLSSEKDRSENLMIVDLLRNDLGKVCKSGSIKVPRLFGLESYANVHHLVSTVTGELNDKSSLFELMESAFPGGSVTGAPKIRSMEIIRELETSARNVYCGAVGYVSSNGNMDTSITIRTLVAENGNLHCWGGGAIVADSDCHEEYQESITKVKNLMNGLEKFLQ